MTSPYADLRARLAPLAADMERLIEERAERHYSTSYETSGFYVLSGSNLDDLIAYAISLVPLADIVALLARGEAAEAVVDYTRHKDGCKRTSLDVISTECTCGLEQILAVARRDPS